MPRKPPRHTPRSPSVESTHSPAEGERLQKVLAAAGIASRRECELLIQEGRIEVDRKVVTELGTRVDPRRQEIRVDGTPLGRPRTVHYLVNKPAGVVSTNRDPEGRTRVVDLIPSESRLFTVGRLDRSSEGLILVTNDGELANQLSHPRFGIPKTYHARVLGFPTPETLQQLRTGVHLAEGLARVASLRARGRHTRGAELELVLTEGRNREIRRILARVGHKVLHLRRVAIGPVRLGTLQPGQWRQLSGDELRQLRAHVKRGRAATESKGGSDPSAQRGGVSQTRRPKRIGEAAGARTGPIKRAKKRVGAAMPVKPKASSGDDSYQGTVLEYDRSERRTGGRPSKKSAGKKPLGKKSVGKKPAGKRPAGKKPAGKRPAGKGRPHRRSGEGKGPRTRGNP